MSELYRRIVDRVEELLRSHSPPTVYNEPRSPIGFLGLYGRYAYVHDARPTVFQILGLNLLHDHFSGRRVMMFKLGIIEVWAFNPDTRDAVPISVFGVPLSYVPHILPMLQREGYRFMTIEHVLGTVTVPEENVYNIEHVAENIGDTVIIDPQGLMRKVGAVLPPSEQLARIIESERELHRLRLLLTNVSIQYRKVLNDYTVMSETVTRLRELVDTLYSQLSSIMQRVTHLESEVRRLSEESRIRRREAMLYRTVASYRELENMSMAVELPSRLREIRTEIATLMETLRSLEDEVRKIRESITPPTPPSTSQAQAQTATAGSLTSLKRFFRYEKEGER